MIFEYNMKAKADTVAHGMMSMTDKSFNVFFHHEDTKFLRFLRGETVFSFC